MQGQIPICVSRGQTYLQLALRKNLESSRSEAIIKVANWLSTNDTVMSHKVLLDEVVGAAMSKKTWLTHTMDAVHKTPLK
jgi:hypothetical protein